MPKEQNRFKGGLIDPWGAHGHLTGVSGQHEVSADTRKLYSSAGEL